MLTASIVLYNTPKPEIGALLSCVQPHADMVYLIDNSPNDRFRQLEKQFDNIRYIYSQNVGYGAAHNVALREAIEAGADFHLILNPDIQFSPDIIQRMTAYMRVNQDVVYMLPKVLYPDGECQYLCKLLPTPFDLIFRRFLPESDFSRKLNARYCLKFFGYNKIINPPCLSGCFMFLRMSFIKEYNLFFDEQFFMYCEDVDFIRRLHRIGKTIYYPKLSIIHDHTKESYKSTKMLFEHIKSAIKYFNKWGWFFDKERKIVNKKVLEELGYMKSPDI
jgi:GT2 family glycosyltransferase